MAPPFRFPELVVPTVEFPEGERQATFLVASHAALLSVFAYRISAAVGLIEFCDVMRSDTSLPRNVSALSEWQEIAARDAAINIYHFCKSLECVRSIRAPTLRERLDAGALKQADRITRGLFPDFIAIRDAVGHSADFIKSTESLAGHMVDGKEFAMGKLNGRTFTITNSGRHYSLILDSSLRTAVQRIEGIVFEAFMNAGMFQEPS